MEQQASKAVAGGTTVTLMEEKINRLKGRLEERLARSHSKALWEGMIEDCEIILDQLKPKEHDKASQENGLWAGHASVLCERPVVVATEVDPGLRRVQSMG
jgi:hypothetical protein